MTLKAHWKKEKGKDDVLWSWGLYIGDSICLAVIERYSRRYDDNPPFKAFVLSGEYVKSYPVYKLEYIESFKTLKEAKKCIASIVR